MVAISRFPGTLDKVVQVLEVAGLVVYDTIEESNSLADCVRIGWDGDESGRFKTGDTRQNWAGTVGATRRDEEFDIICCAIARRGDNSVKLVRDAAYDLMGTVESTLRANPGLGFTPPYVAGVRPRETFISPWSDGIVARVVFFISVSTRV